MSQIPRAKRPIRWLRLGGPGRHSTSASLDPKPLRNKGFRLHGGANRCTIRDVRRAGRGDRRVGDPRRR